MQLTITAKVEAARGGWAIAGSLLVRRSVDPYSGGPASYGEWMGGRIPGAVEPSTVQRRVSGPTGDATDNWDEDDDYFAPKRHTGWLE